MYLRKLEKEQIKFKLSRRKEIRIETELSEIENRTSLEKINIIKSLFFKKINRLDKPLARLREERGHRFQ